MKKILKIGLTLLLVMIILTGCTTSKLEFQATVTDIEVATGTAAAKASATVYFDDGQVLVFDLIDANRLTIGQKYFIKCHRTQMSDKWAIDLLEER